MYKLNLLFFSFYGLFSACVAQNQPVILPGQCDLNIPVVQNFNATAYLGEWRLIESYFSDFQSGTCNKALYSAAQDGSVVVYNTQVVNQELASITGSAVLSSTDGSAKLSVTFPNSPAPVDYWVLTTDYLTYSLVYSCANLANNQKRVWSWKLSRTNTLTPAATTSINQVVNSVSDLSNNNYQIVDRTDAGCFYYPTLTPGSPVIFPGQCDQNIPVVTNFNATAYLGEWRLIQSYFSNFQSGTCNKALYSAGQGGSVIVYNTQVVNQELASITGSAVLASSDGSAKLSVTFPNSPAPIDYWVLATDYSTYSLVYSCVNVNAEQRQVWSWKLSRTNTLTPAATTVINQVVNSVNVLDDRYYETVDRTDAGCFYYPTLTPGSPVIFPGQCDQNIPVVTNFNATAYLGEWRLIQSYFSNFQSGTCNKALYSAGQGGSVIVYNTQVVNQELASITGSAVLASSDGSAKLSVTFPNSPAPIDYWVLATDYSTYSLVYSCVNVNAEQRQVWSWKLSRTNTLTTAATTVINQVVNSVNVLDDRYYETVDRTDAGCFYYPTLTPGSPVIFPGQCDQNIPVVTNFNATAYLGEWRLIQSYFSNFQSGTCNKALYSAGQGGSVIVYNTQVVNQELASITGSAVLASSDGSAKLSVTFPNSPAPIDYWVLATDYSTYSLVYSCVNVNAEQRQVWSWKLSRTNTLTTGATTVINQVVNSVNVLDDRYYQTVDRTDAGCFYYPTLTPGSPVIFPGQCDQNIPVVTNFNATAYLGEWRLIQSYFSSFQSGTCNTAQYSAAQDGSVIVYNTQVVNQELASSTGSAVLASSDGSAKLSVTFPNSPAPIDYWILATDYSTYSLVYSCANVNAEQRQVWSWKLSRTNTLTPAATTVINQVVNSVNVLDDRYYQTVDRTDTGCFYYPTLTPGSPVIFPGQCDQNIPAVPNFNATAYLGEWRLIESYFSNFQQGTCNTAQYSAFLNGSVIVYNTEVLNQELRNSTGIATLASNDGSAKLSVIFPNSPTPIDYWVLTTDYTSTSLVYSCVNLDSERRRVWSWKLSRTNTLTPAGINSINQVVNSINVLDDRYYQTVNRSDDGCFYYPRPSPTTPVILPGQCDVNIPVVPNFNVSAFSGTWYHIERFNPIGTSTCVGTIYDTTAERQYNVRDFEVVNGGLVVTQGEGQAAVDGSGKITISRPNTVSTNLYILTTDYIDYALTYTCVNINQEQRQIGAWKLSRQRNLTSAANTAINAVVTARRELHEQYFNLIPHNDNCLEPNSSFLFKSSIIVVLVCASFQLVL